ncbi:hypothetical protein VW35_17010 [Devosia soli]|uniref:Uncharacterized protein n=1 Tax=Devosia soli TaxID=361041 RepID=A0A0F5L245_9HYPH|nr:DUF6626 family protein [Devosia soli]KKB76496.1 hypothetical protein VW35_17010 [Devosia soli]
MTQGIEFLEVIYEQLHEAGIIRSKGEFSERLLGKSPSYLTSMRARKRVISGEVIMGLGDRLMAEIAELGSDPSHAQIRSELRRAVAWVNYHLADQTIPDGIVPWEQPTAKSPQAPKPMAWLRVLASILAIGSVGRISS